MSNLWRYPKRKQKLQWQEAVIALAMLALGILCFTVLSCNTVSKATGYLKEKGKLAEVCATEFPVHDSIIVNDSVHFDTLYIPEAIQMGRDTVIINGQPIPFFTKCPPPMIITKTVTKDSIIIRTDKAAEAAMKIQRDDLITVNKDLLKERDTYKAQARKSGFQKWLTWILLFIGLVGGFILKLKKVF